MSMGGGLGRGLGGVVDGCGGLVAFFAALGGMAGVKR
jgi:hypothetical protein